MKLVINSCYGGFGLSKAATKRLAELQGRKCFFFKQNFSTNNNETEYQLDDMKENSLFWTAFDIPNPNEVVEHIPLSKWHDTTPEEQNRVNKTYSDYVIYYRYINRSDPLLLQVIEELGTEVCSGRCAELKVIEIPDGVDYEIDEYDGLETVHEKHRSWS